MKKGDIVFFHPLLIHGSGENRSQGFRKSFCCHFAASECEYIPIEGTVQEVVAKEVMSYISKLFPGVTDAHSIWRTKSRLVCGRTFEGKL
jgi:phytanoyl-CoA hydroxylase